MRIGIYTQKLENNYGGILQNYALHQVLKSLGHVPITFDFRPKTNLFWYFISQCKNFLFILMGKKRTIKKYKKGPKRSVLTEQFIKNNINTSWRMQFITPLVPLLLKIECAITGSDQVWRPSYNILSYAYLKFIKRKDIKKIAYAASFGVDTWEYSENDTKKCRQWIKDFTAISVREDSGVILCEKYLGVNAVHVLDPTLLLTKEVYGKLCSNINPICNNPFLAAYILDMSKEKELLVRRIAQSKGLKCIIFSAEKNISITIEQWLSIYRDASYVVTDSFHGTVFSIIFRKSFNTIINESRGASRFESLLSIFNLKNRLITMDRNFFQTDEIIWSNIESILNEWTIKSVDFLRNNL